MIDQFKGKIELLGLFFWLCCQCEKDDFTREEIMEFSQFGKNKMLKTLTQLINLNLLDRQKMSSKEVFYRAIKSEKDAFFSSVFNSILIQNSGEILSEENCESDNSEIVRFKNQTALGVNLTSEFKNQTALLSNKGSEFKNQTALGGNLTLRFKNQTALSGLEGNLEETGNGFENSRACGICKTSFTSYSRILDSSKEYNIKEKKLIKKRKGNSEEKPKASLEAPVLLDKSNIAAAANGEAAVPKSSKKRIDKVAIKKAFSDVRDLYPGKKRGLDTEFEYFMKKCKKDHFKELKNIYLGIRNSIDKRNDDEASRTFVPEWQHFKTFIHQRSWEMYLDDR